MEDEAKFTELIKRVMDRHADVVPMIARGVLSSRWSWRIARRGEERRRVLILRRRGSSSPSNKQQRRFEEVMAKEMPEIHQFLDGFYMSRIGIRMLMGSTWRFTSPPWRTTSV